MQSRLILGLYPWETKPWHSLNRSMGGPLSQSGDFTKEMLLAFAKNGGKIVMSANL
jgi:hypothetical protein